MRCLAHACRFFCTLVPALKPSDLQTVLTYMHLLDLDGDGSFEFKEIICVSLNPLQFKYEVSLPSEQTTFSFAGPEGGARTYPQRPCGKSTFQAQEPEETVIHG